MRFQVSVAETGHADSWQRCELGVALVSAEVAIVESLADEIERFVWHGDAEILEVDRCWLETDGWGR